MLSGVFLNGSDHNADWPHNRVSVLGEHAVFTPVAGSTNLEYQAYAIYLFDTTGIETDGTLRLDWERLGAISNLWVGLANFARGRWDWYAGPEDGMLEYDKSLYEDQCRLYAVILCTGADEWELNSLRLVPEIPLAVTGVSPLSGITGYETTFSATISGSTAITWLWDFGTAAEPSTSSNESPTVTLKEPGTYDCSVTASNIINSDTFDFQLEIILEPPIIKSVSPLLAGAGEERVFTAELAGTAPTDWLWEFGDAAVPSTSTEASPMVELGQEGVYPCTVTASNANGSAVFDFQLTLAGEGDYRSDWWMYMRSPRHAAQSIFNGPTASHLKWLFPATSCLLGSPVIAADGTVYIGEMNGMFYAINPDGTKKWEYKTTDYIDHSAAIGLDGTVYIANVYGMINALNPDGTLKWQYDIGQGVQTDPVIGPKGTIYFLTINYNLIALYPFGGLKWTRHINNMETTPPIPAIGPDGTIYVRGDYKKLLAISPDGELLWSFDTYMPLDASPAVAPDGTIYAAIQWRLYAINPDGSEKWKVDTFGGSYLNNSPAVGKDGTIYLATGSAEFSAFNPDGSLKWTISLTSSGETPTIGANGTIYLPATQSIFSISPQGNVLWEYFTNNYVAPLAAIGPDGTLYVGNWDNNLFAFGPSVE